MTLQQQQQEQQVVQPELGSGPHALAEPHAHRFGGRRRSALLVAGALLLGLMAVSVLLRLEGQRNWLWIDEGISVGISSHHLSDLPRVLRQDGSPPLYYLLLHGWMRLFGSSEAATHGLSLLFAVATVPVGLWAGRSLFGRRTGWVLAALAATNPFLTFYSYETRMYTLVALLSMFAIATYLLAFAAGRRRYLPLFVVSLTLLLYTHNWGLFFAAGAAAGLVPCLMASTDRRRRALDGLLAFGAVGLLYVPWVPTLLFQARHTGAPWSPVPVLRELVSVGGAVLGDERVLIAVLFGGGAALVAALRRPSTPDGAALAATVVIVAVTLGGAWVGAHLKPGWAARYFGIVVGPVLLLAAVGLARSGVQGAAALLLVLLLWTQPLGRITGARAGVKRDSKSVEEPLAAAVAPHLQGGDVVVAFQPEEVPVLHYYLAPRVPGLRYATPMGPVADPTIMDWRDALARLRASSVATALEPLVGPLPTGQGVLLVCRRRPMVVGPGELAWSALSVRRCLEWQAALGRDPRFQALPVPDLDSVQPATSEAVKLYRKVGA